MTKDELIDRVYDSITDRSFSGYVYATYGGKCGSNWDCEAELELTRDEIIDLIGNCDPCSEYEDTILEMAFDMAWPDGPTEEADDFSYGGNFESLEDYISNLNDLIDDIEEGNVTEDDIDERIDNLDI